MPKYFYKAYALSKEKKEGIVEAENKQQALVKLDSSCLFPLGVELVSDNKGNVVKAGRVKSKDIVIFTRQISNLLEAGLTISNAIALIARQKLNPHLQLVIGRLKSDLKEGMMFSEALSQHPRIFPKLYIALVKSGESGGFLEEIMNKLAGFLENEEEVKTKIKSAMAYPVFIAVMGLATIFILLAFVIPKLTLVFEDVGQILPLPTQILVGISNLLNKYFWISVLAAALTVFVVNRILRNPKYIISFDKFKLQTPIIGKIIIRREMERFCRVLAMLLSNGLTIMPSLEIVSAIIENSILRKEIISIRLLVKNGLSLDEAMAKSKYFPVSLIDIISVGGETGNLENVLSKIAITYDKEIDRDTKTFISLLEPAMILIMGSIVAFIVVAMLLPIFQINFIQGG
ncbi:MAG: type II secretion system F family protein [Candidatus Omnitrophica bacterium]|nr:type II secretion system F family protein [Candidatus Omnitrophota bacterium]